MLKIKRGIRKDVLLFILLVTVLSLTRLVNILKLPIFTDEAIYMRWAQIALHDASWRFISLTDGKQPLFIWFTALTMKFLHNPLLSGRLVSYLSGLVGMTGLLFLGWELFKKKSIGFISALLYIISPFFLWYDKMALMDSLLSAFYVWSIYFTILLVRYLRLDLALILGLTTGGAILTKTSGFFSLYLLPMAIFLLPKKKPLINLFKFSVLSIVTIIFAVMLYNILRLSPWFYIITQKNQSFIYSFSEIINNPFQYFFGNINSLISWWLSYFTIPFTVVLVVGLILSRKHHLTEKIMLLSYFTIPFIALAFFGKVLYPRFILFMTVALIPLTAYSLLTILSHFKKTTYKIFVISMIFAYPVYIGTNIVLNPLNASLPISDRKQYLDEWPSGYGVNEVIDFLKEEKERQPIFVATEGTFGLFPYSLELEFYSDPKIKIKGYWPLPTFQQLIYESEGRPSYLILKESQEPPLNWTVTLVNQYRRGKGSTFLKFYKIIK